MQDIEAKDTRNSFAISKPVAALAGLGLAVGLGWTLTSGFKNPPTTLATPSNTVSIDWPYRGLCSDLTIAVNGQPVEFREKILKGGLAHASFPVSTGSHQAVVTFHSLVPGLNRDYALEIIVDQQPPPLDAVVQGGIEAANSHLTIEEELVLSGVTEPGVQLALENRVLEYGESGEFKETVALQPGWNHMLLTAIDLAGNRTARRFSIFRDTADPEVVWQTAPDQVFDQKSARLELEIKDDGRIAGVSGQAGREKAIIWHAKGEGRWVGITPELHEGFHEISVRVADAAGRVTSSKRQIVIDSSEVLGESALGLGARGEDVRQLHKRLSEAGYLAADKISSVFDSDTQAALESFQKAEGFEVTGLADGETLIALGPKIFINLGSFSLVLDRPGQEPKRWTIASGTGDYPTPTGRYVIYEKVMHPTWLPPKSEWAKDAKPVPPGPDNPLGTRWLGFDWGSVGIHGTNAPWTVGTASSHGCLRMVTSQVEELFELVEVGTPVLVLGGWENDPVLDKYWPSDPPEQEEGEEVARR
ncbi:MAG: L,D-transpeptidase family protein [Vulcanimicrobiota bacterium]